ncbi:MAG: type II toxin-antitoxin system VapC family toxin [Planctomycetaceae bacterium]
MRILVDTNVLLRSAEPGHAHFQFSVYAIDLLRSHGHDLLIVPQILYEYWSVATRPLANNGFGLSPAEATVELSMLRTLFRLLQDERGIYSMWHDLVVQHAVRGKQAHDARLAAAAQRHLITHVLIFNTTDFQRYSFLTAVSPSDICSGAITI